jgi:starch synthase
VGIDKLRILHVCAEIFPLLKTGGLADVSAALPPALERLDCDVHMLVPGFPEFMQGLQEKHLVAELEPRFGAHALRLWFGTLPTTGIDVYCIEAPGLYDRPGNPYADQNHRPYADNHRRFALLGWMAARIADGLDFFWKPHVVHGHDWHAGLACAYIKAAEQARGIDLAGTVFTIHNLAYQGNFPAEVFGELDLPADFFRPEGLEFYGQVSFLKSGLYYADKITTVSPTYAREIQHSELGCGHEGLLRHRAGDLVGILNGVDTEVWNPATDPAIPAHYRSNALSGKIACRQALQRETGLEEQGKAPLFCVVSRLVQQKGLHLVLDALDLILARGGQLVILGSGNHDLERGFQGFAERYPRQVSVQIGYDELKAHRMIAGSDIIIVPSLYEPCGLTQLYGLMYGTLPLVHRTGGLADTVTDSSPENLAAGMATGFVFDRFDADALRKAMERIFHLYKERRVWQKMQRQAMRQNFTWDAAARQYLTIYDQVRHGD